MGTDFYGMMGHCFSSDNLDQLPIILNNIWKANERLIIATKALSHFRNITLDHLWWQDVWHSEKEDRIGKVEGPGGCYLNIYRHRLEYWNYARYRRGFMSSSELSQPLRVICREMAIAVGAEFVMYLPDWALDNVAPDEEYGEYNAAQVYQFWVENSATFLDLTGIPDEINLKEFEFSRTSEEWPYFMEAVNKL
ncbi:MAG: hypothetical protein AB1489_27855 [Acidobacteriota bacterium]